MHTRTSNSKLVEPLPEPERTLNRRLCRRNRSVPFEQRNKPPAQPRVVSVPIYDINYFLHFLDILENYNPMDDEPMWAADRVVALTPGSAITIPETANEFAIKSNHLTLVKGNQFDGQQGTRFEGVTDWYQSQGYREPGGIPRVIILGYDGLPLQPVAPPSPDYIPGPENPQTPPVPQDEDEREPMKALPPVDSPTAESPGYVTESDPEEDPEEYEDDETEDGPVDYPMDGGDDGDDDDGDSSKDDANDEDEDEEDEEDEEEEEHLAPADSTTVRPADEPVFPPEGTEPVIPPPPLDITVAARDLPSDPRLPYPFHQRQRCTAPPAHSPPLPPSSGCLTQIQTLRIASTQALIDAVTAALPPPPLPPLSLSLYIPPPVDRRDDIPESEQPPHKRHGRCWKRGDRGLEMLGYEIRDPWGTCNALLEDAHDSMVSVYQRVDMDSQLLFKWLGSLDRIGARQLIRELQNHRASVYAHGDPSPGTPDTATAAEYSHSDTSSGTRDSLSYAADWTELLALREPQRRARQPGPEARSPDHRDASGDADTYTERFQELTLICTKFVANETEKVDKYIGELPDNIYGNVKSARPPRRWIEDIGVGQ
ncbi:hypothetical protein Tco_0351973 [Tanacetum coccineum]